MKRILAFVSGMSPAIITETIYALATSSEPWIADEIYVLTTKTGKNKIQQELLDSGVYAKLCQQLDIDCKNYKLNAKNIEVVCNMGVELDDIRTKEDNDNFANFIVSKIHHLCNNEDSEVYVSLAGGRKTMSYYMGYALSLFGRPQDKLFHVLVSEPFDGNVVPTFYYPDDTEYTKRLDSTKHFGKDAKLELAEIPFISLRQYLPKTLEKHGHFNDYIQNIQTNLDNHIRTLSFDYDNRLIICNNTPVKLEPQQLAIYDYFVSLKFNADEDEQNAVIQDIRAEDIYQCITKVTRGEGLSAENFKKTYYVGKKMTPEEKSEKHEKFQSALRSNLTNINKTIEQEMRLKGWQKRILEDFKIQGVEVLFNRIQLYTIKISKENIILGE